jgi:hypothetical protein
MLIRYGKARSEVHFLRKRTTLTNVVGRQGEEQQGADYQVARHQAAGHQQQALASNIGAKPPPAKRRAADINSKGHAEGDV